MKKSLKVKMPIFISRLSNFYLILIFFLWIIAQFGACHHKKHSNQNLILLPDEPQQLPYAAPPESYTEEMSEKIINENKFESKNWALFLSNFGLYESLALEDQTGSTIIIAYGKGNTWEQKITWDKNTIHFPNKKHLGHGIHIIKIDPLGNLQWIKFLGGGMIDDLKIDHHNNIILAGFLFGPELFLQDAVSNNEKHLLSQNGGGDAFIVKLKPDGDLFSKDSKVFIGGSQKEKIDFIKTDHQNYFLVKGTCHSQFLKIGLDFSLNCDPNGSSFIISLDPNSYRPIWGKTLPVSVTHLVTTIENDLILAGTFRDKHAEIKMDDFELMGNNNDCQKNSVLSILKLDGKTGQTLWLQQESPEKYTSPTNLMLTAEEDVIVNGKIIPHNLDNCELDYNEISQFFTKAYDRHGNFSWEIHMEGLNDSQMDEQGSLYFFGNSKKSILYQGEEVSKMGQYFLKLDAQGNLIFANLIHIPNTKTYSGEIDKKGNLVVWGNVCVNHSRNIEDVASRDYCQKNYFQEFIRKYNSDGVVEWHQIISGHERYQASDWYFSQRLFIHHTSQQGILASITAPPRSSIVHIGDVEIFRTNEAYGGSFYLFQIKESGEIGWVHEVFFKGDDARNISKITLNDQLLELNFGWKDDPVIRLFKDPDGILLEKPFEQIVLLKIASD